MIFLNGYYFTVFLKLIGSENMYISDKNLFDHLLDIVSIKI